MWERGKEIDDDVENKLDSLSDVWNTEHFGSFFLVDIAPKCRLIRKWRDPFLVDISPRNGDKKKKKTEVLFLLDTFL